MSYNVHCPSSANTRRHPHTILCVVVSPLGFPERHTKSATAERLDIGPLVRNLSQTSTSHQRLQHQPKKPAHYEQSPVIPRSKSRQVKSQPFGKQRSHFPRSISWYCWRVDTRQPIPLRVASIQCAEQELVTSSLELIGEVATQRRGSIKLSIVAWCLTDIFSSEPLLLKDIYQISL